jgi:DNA-binding NarL/FixJ family response regulator
VEGGAAVRAVVGEDQLITRQGIVALLASIDVDVVGEAATLPELMRCVRECRPDLAVVDVRMPPGQRNEGIVAAASIREELPGTGVLLLSQHVEADFALGLLGDQRSGVAGAGGGLGYLLKDRVLNPETFRDSVQRVVAGECVLDPSLIDLLMARSRTVDPLASLTSREREVLSLLAEGHTNAGISAQLVLSERTVEVHVRSVFAKLDILEDEGRNKRVLAVLQYLSATS